MGRFQLQPLLLQVWDAINQLLLQSEQIKEAYEERLKEDPDLATDTDKRAAFFPEQLTAAGGPQALFAGRDQTGDGTGGRVGRVFRGAAGRGGAF